MAHGACRAAVRLGAGAVVWGPERSLENLALLWPGLRELCRCETCGTACAREATAQTTLDIRVPAPCAHSSTSRRGGFCHHPCR